MDRLKSSLRNGARMGRIGRGWHLSKVSFGIIRQDKELLLFPFLSLIISGFAWGGWLAAVFFLDLPFVGRLATDFPVLYYAIYFGFFFLTAFIAVYFQAAIVGSALIRLEGGSPTFGDGLRQANRHVGKLFLWAVLSATVGLILRAVRQQAGFIGQIVAGAIGIAWSLASYMAVPVIVVEGLGPWKALKRSASLFVKKWGETLVGSLGVGLIVFLFGLVGAVPLVVGILLLMSTELIVIGLVLILAAVLYWFVVFLLGAAAWAVLSAVLYRYAAEGKLTPGVSEELLASVVRA